MQIVIDISKEKYDEIMAMDWANCRRFFDEEIRAIHDGTPLPKGHGRLIDADEIQFERTEFETYGDYCIAFDAIDQADTIIEADTEGSESE